MNKFGSYTRQIGDPNEDTATWWAGYESVIHCNNDPIISQLTLDIELMWAKEHQSRILLYGIWLRNVIAI